MSSICNSPELIAGPLYVTSERSRPKTCQDNTGKPVTGSAYIQGPVQMGKDDEFSSVNATVMIGNMKNNQTVTPDRSLHVKGDVIVEGNGKTDNALKVEGPTDYPLYVGGNAYFDHPNIGDLSDRFNTADARPKPFDMVHPSLGEGNRLRYACIEGPEVGVYFRGRLKNKTEIELPWYWKDLVHTESISVQLQPIGSHQNIIIKRWDNEKIYLQSNGGMPIDCFYHVYAERKDVNALVVEYEGNKWSDYPDTDYNDPQYANKVNTKTL